jgi:hypothetical protein
MRNLDRGWCWYRNCMIHTRERRLPGPRQRRLTEAEVRAIRQDPAAAPQLALTYGVSDSTIRHIRQRKIYRDVH